MNSSPSQKRENNQLRVAIKEDQITVPPEGRATIQVGILNESPKEDYLDILVKGVPPEWVTIPTPVLHLDAGEAKLVTLTVQPSAISDPRVGQYPLDVHIVSQSDPTRLAVARSVLTVAAYQSTGRIGVMLGSIHFSVTPGTSIDIPILLQNRGDAQDSFRLNVTGLPAHWISSNSTLTQLEPNTSAEVLLTIQVPRSPQAAAGRNPFTIQFLSQRFPTQTSAVECVLTVAAYSQFSASLEPGSLQADQVGQVIVSNEGNTIDAYSLTFQSRTNELIFEKAVQVARPGPQGTQQVGIAYVEIPQGERFQVPAGERGAQSFRARLRSRPILGNEETYPFGVEVRSTQNKSMELSAQVSEAGYLPFWVLPVGVVGSLLLCLLFLIPLRGIPTSARATQTAAFSQTQAALSGTADPDGDGLPNDREAALGTDPLLPDTDSDRLLDREEVETYQTNPLLADTDADRLSDGDEVQTHLTDPRNPDMDGDGRLDGDEIAGGTDPRNPDNDGDGLRDGDEIKLETDPRNPDTDGDGRRDGEENATCPLPTDPDSDDDGITDGRDLDPCNASNPALTATAAAGIPPATATVAAPTVTQTLPPAPTQTPLPTNTSPPAATLTAPPPSLQGTMLFASNRTGNSEIYALNLANQSIARLTNSTAQEVQPALAPDSIQVAYVSNQDGNNEIYLSGLDGRTPLNLTNNPADDQQPTWSPDGNWIAFTTNRDGNQEIYVMRRDGSQLRNLTTNAGNDFAPSWFSIGSLFGLQDWIAFTTTRDGNQEVYKVRPDASSLTNLTQNPANDHSPAGFAGGATLAFVSDRNGNPEIFVMTDTGGSQSNITNHPAQDLDPAINPGGTWVAFSTDRDGNLEIYVVRINGGAASNLTRDPSQDSQPDW
jgi:Tol biopolymer transport system component